MLTHWSIHCKPQFAPKISKNLSKISKNLSKMGQDGAKMGPKPSQEGSQRRSEAIKKTKKTSRWDNKHQNPKKCHPLGPHFGGPRAPKRGPRPSPERPIGWMAPPRSEAVVRVGLRCFVCCVVCCCWCCGVCCGVLLYLVVLFCLVLFVLCWLVWGADGKEKRSVKTSSERCFWEPKLSKNQ